jgi:zinc finger HIT domain-containing protein 1
MEQPQQRLTRQTKENLSSATSSSRILDASTRARRAQKFLESLEQDNYHDDPTEPSSSFDSTLTPEQIAKNLSNTSAFGYSRHSKGLILESDEPTTKTTSNSSNKRRKIQFKYDVFKTRFRKNLQTLLDEELGPNGEKSEEKKNYFTIAAKPSKYPPIKLCSVCGFTSQYTCHICGSLYCSLKCLDIHKDTRCLKYTV